MTNLQDKIAALKSGDYSYLYLVARRKAGLDCEPQGWEEIAWERGIYIECMILRKPTAELTTDDKDNWLPYHGKCPNEWFEPENSPFIEMEQNTAKVIVLEEHVRVLREALDAIIEGRMVHYKEEGFDVQTSNPTDIAIYALDATDMGE